MDITTYIISAIINGIIFGIITNAIMQKKGYDGGFGWGFWLGVIGLVIVICKDNLKKEEPAYAPPAYSIPRSCSTQQPNNAPANVPVSGWRCTCGRANANYVSTCACGVSKFDVLINKATAPASPAPSIASSTETAQTSKMSEDECIAVLKQYKELLDSGILTEEEFAEKKKQLLKN